MKPKVGSKKRPCRWRAAATRIPWTPRRPPRWGAIVPSTIRLHPVSCHLILQWLVLLVMFWTSSMAVRAKETPRRAEPSRRRVCRAIFTMCSILHSPKYILSGLFCFVYVWVSNSCNIHRMKSINMSPTSGKLCFLVAVHFGMHRNLRLEKCILLLRLSHGQCKANLFIRWSKKPINCGTRKIVSNQPV